MSQLSKNPRIVRELIRSIIDSDFDGNVQRTAETISEVALSRLRTKREYKPLTASILYSIMSDQAHIRFSHLEMIATYLGMPVGILLVCTRVMASHRDKDEVDIQFVSQMVHRLEGFIDDEGRSYDQVKQLASGKQGSLL